MGNRDIAAGSRLGAFDDLCKQHGIKATHQRMEIYRELVLTEEHPDAETIYRKVRARVPSISLDTVYRTLRLFEEKDMISRVGLQGDKTRFDGNTRQHHHFVCVQCGLVSDFYSDELNHFPPPRDVRAMGAVESVHVEMRGVCRACRKQRREAGKS